MSFIKEVMEIEMEKENELIEHKIKIDEYISAEIKIPKVLTAMDLKALMYKANKLFNLAEVPIVEKRKYVRNGKDIVVNNTEDVEFLEKYNKLDIIGRKELAKSIGITVRALYQKVFYIKRNTKLKVDFVQNRKRKYSDEFVQKIVDELKKNKSSTVEEIANKLGIQRQRIFVLMRSRLDKTPKEIRMGI